MSEARAAATTPITGAVGELQGLSGGANQPAPRRPGRGGWLSATLTGSALVLSALACDNIVPAEDAAPQQQVNNQCSGDADCSEGTCHPELGACILGETSLQNIILEIIPASNDEGIGGFHFFVSAETMEPIDDAVADRISLAVEGPAIVSGNVLASLNQNEAAGCGDAPRQVNITFTPVEKRLGFDAVSYKVTSELEYNTRIGVLQHTYSFRGLPEGTYDVYWEDALGTVRNPSSLCEIVPRLERDVEVRIGADGRVPQLDLESQAGIRALRVKLDWRPELDGWRVDAIHQRTGERVSTRGVVVSEQRSTSAAGEDQAFVDLLLGPVIGNDFVEPGRELLRLTPPPESDRPTVLMGLEGLELFSVGEVLVPDLELFEELIEYQAWVWRDNDPDQPVAGTAEFNAIQLTDIPEGVSVDLFRQATIDSDGRVHAQLLPGTYLVRILPADPELAAFEVPVEVFKPLIADLSDESPDGLVQAGRVIAAPEPAEILGRVDLPMDSPAFGISVEASSPSRSGLPNVLAPSPFFPRTVEALVEERGDFRIQPADCGRCELDFGALFDIRVVPPATSVLPWAVRPDVLVGERVDLEPLAVSLPFLFERQLGFTVRASDGTLRASESAPNALVRAYVLLDAQGGLATTDLPGCSDLPDGNSTELDPCVRRAVQIGASRADDAGLLRLYLPAELDFGVTGAVE